MEALCDLSLLICTMGDISQQAVMEIKLVNSSKVLRIVPGTE